jgi:hypothetical protein
VTSPNDDAPGPVDVKLIDDRTDPEPAPCFAPDDAAIDPAGAAPAGSAQPRDPTKPPGIGPWSEAAKSSWRAWRNYYPTLALARRDPHTYYATIDECAELVGISPRNFYRRYLATGELPYRIVTWMHGPRRKRRKSLIPRALMMERLLAGLTREVKATYRRRGRLQMDRLQHELEQLQLGKLPAESGEPAPVLGPGCRSPLVEPSFTAGPLEALFGRRRRR